MTMQAAKPIPVDAKPFDIRVEAAPWPLPEQRDLYRKGTMGRQGQLGPRYQSYAIPRYQFAPRDLDRCLYGKQDLQVVHIDNKNTDGAPEDKSKPAKWCDMCQEIRFGDCPAHGPLHAVRPSITLPESQKSYAISTFPEEVGLCISSIPLAGYGVFARHFIPLGTWIGPYEGLKISVEEGLSRPQQQNFMWEIYENGRLCSFLDASDENGSSWMRFIQCARHKGEQNLYVFQYYRSIYYRAFKDIPVGSELMVWYDEKYPHFFGLPMEIRDMSSCSVESIQAPVEVASKLAEGDPSKSNASATAAPIRQSSAGPPKPYADQFRGMAQVSPQPPSIHSQGQTTSSKPGQPPVHPPLLSQAPNLHVYDSRLPPAAVASTFMENRLPHPHDSRYQAQIPLSMPVPHMASGYLQASNIVQSARPVPSTVQNALPKSSLGPPPQPSREFHEEKPQPPSWEAWKCSNCPKVFADKLQFQAHSCAPEGQRQYSYERTMQQGQDIHPENPEKPYKCGVCSKHFTSSVNLSNHMRVHGGEKPFECQNCGKTFVLAAAFNRHMKTPGECSK